MSFYILLTQFILIFTFYITMVHLSKQRKEDKCACVCSVMSETLLTPWTIPCKALLSLEFSRQEYWSGLPFSIPEDLPNPVIKSMSPKSPALAGKFFTTGPPDI